MSSRGRGRARGYFGRGSGGSAPYRHREEHAAHRGGEEHHGSSHYRGGGGSHFSPRGGSAGEYSSRHHKEMMGAPVQHHSSRDHHGAGRTDERYHHRHGGSSDRTGYDHREHHSSSSRRSPPPLPPAHHRRPSPSMASVKRHEHVPMRRHEQILSKLAPEEQYALTKALVATVLQESEGRGGGGRGYRDDRGMRDDRDRGYRDETSGRDFRDRRPPPFAGPSSRYQGRGGYREDRGRGVYRGRGFRGAPRGGRYESGVQQRLSIPYRGGHDTGYRRKYADYEQSDQPFKRQRLNSGGDAAATGDEERLESQAGADDVVTDEEATADAAASDTKKTEASADTDEEAAEDGAKKVTAPVEGAAEGERAPWREGVGRLFVELQCPHCPAHCSITLKEYKYHLSSGQHLSNMNRLAYKHSQLLMRIRKQQRHQQKQLEDDYLTEHPDQAELSVSRFCGTCKLNYRCLGGDIKEGLTAHCKSRLHKMQHNYLHPRCLVCRQKGEVATRFKSRMVYEHHVASITHMKSKMEKLEMCPDDAGDDDVGELDDFLTVDSVGEDEEIGTEEHDEITGDAEAQELAKKAAEAGSDDVDDDGPLEDDGSFEPIGMSFVQARKVFFCQLCLLGLKDSDVKRHCSTLSHRTKYFAAKKKAAAAKEAEASSRRKSSDFPRSGGRAEDRDDDEEEEDDDDDTITKKDKVAGEKENTADDDDEQTATRNGDEDAEMKDNIDEEDKDDSEKDYEEYNEKYEYTDPNHEDYEEDGPEEDDFWDEMDKDLADGRATAVTDRKPTTNGDNNSTLAKKASPSEPSSKKVEREKTDEDDDADVTKTSPKLKRRLRSAIKKDDTDDDEEEVADEEMETEEKVGEEERPVADDASEGEADAAPVDTDEE